LVESHITETIPHFKKKLFGGAPARDQRGSWAVAAVALAGPNQKLTVGEMQMRLESNINLGPNLGQPEEMIVPPYISNGPLIQLIAIGLTTAGFSDGRQF
jgi:hypothetical protein